MSEQTKKQIAKVATEVVLEVVVIVAKKAIDVVSDLRQKGTNVNVKCPDKIE